MAAKNCPQCTKQVPVACKKCGCGHVFFATRRSATSTNRENSEDGSEDLAAQIGDELMPTRRSGRVTRERPQFYDALQYENQTRRQKQLMKQSQSKHGKSEDQDEGSDEGEKPTPSRNQLSQEKSGKDPKSGEPKPKKRRGRPPGITGRKPNQIKITPGGQTIKNQNKSSEGNDAKDNPDSPNDDAKDAAREAEDKALISSITAEKALQYNIVLQDINSKIGRVGWRAQE